MCKRRDKRFNEYEQKVMLRKLGGLPDEYVFIMRFTRDMGRARTYYIYKKLEDGSSVYIGGASVFSDYKKAVKHAKKLAFKLNCEFKE